MLTGACAQSRDVHASRIREKENNCRDLLGCVILLLLTTAQNARCRGNPCGCPQGGHKGRPYSLIFSPLLTEGPGPAPPPKLSSQEGCWGRAARPHEVHLCLASTVPGAEGRWRSSSEFRRVPGSAVAPHGTSPGPHASCRLSQELHPGC